MIEKLMSDDSGNLSSMRVNSAIALVVAIGLSFYAVFKGNQADSFPIILTWVLGAFVPKSIQKFAEKKLEDKK